MTTTDAKTITPTVDQIANNQDASILFVLLFLVIFLVVGISSITWFGYRKLISVIESNTSAITKLNNLTDFFLTSISSKIDKIPSRDEINIHVSKFTASHESELLMLKELLINQREIKTIVKRFSDNDSQESKSS